MNRRAAAEAAIARLRRRHPDVRAVWRGDRETPVLVTGLAVPAPGDDPTARATRFLERWPALIAVPPASLTPEAVTAAAGRAVVRFAQRHGDLPVRGGALVVTLDARGRVIRVVDDTRPVTAVAPATIDAARARELAVRAVHGAPVEAPTTIRAVVLTGGGRAVAGWEVGVARRPLVEDLVVLVDGHVGRVAGVENRVVHR